MPKHSKGKPVLEPTEERDFVWSAFTLGDLLELHDYYGNTYTPAKTITLKGRLEYEVDYRAILHCLSLTPGVIRLHFWQNTLEVTWLLESSHYKHGVIDHREEVEAFIRQFVGLLRGQPDLHVFLQSLKPISQFDGERNGPWFGK